MTDAQSWTLIAGFLTTTFALIGIVSTSFHRVLRAEIGSLRTEFHRIDQRLDHLDRDVQALIRHVFDRPE